MDTTDADGRYSIKLPEGDYTVTPHYQGKRFRPASRSVSISDSTIDGVDFKVCAGEAPQPPSGKTGSSPFSPTAATVDLSHGDRTIKFVGG